MLNEMNHEAAQPAGSEPQVTVLISVFNGECFLRETLDSVLAQDFKDFEVLVINDGSTDGTPSILAEYSADPRFRVIDQENRGLVYSLNRGLEAARADLVARLDADDIALPHRLSRQVEFMRDHPEVALLGSAITLIDKDGRTLKEVVYPTGSAVKSSLSRYCAIAHPSAMMRRSPVLELGGYRPAFRHAEDYDLWLRISERHSIDNLKEALILYRQHEGNVSVRFQEQQTLSTFAAIHCSKRRLAGFPDPMEGKDTPISTLDLLTLKLTESEDAQYHFELIKNALNTSEQDFEPAALKGSLKRIWELRSHLPRGRMARRCLIPAGFAFRRIGDREESRKWFVRGFRTDPLSTVWAMVRSGLQGR